jgi:protein ImuB
MSYSEALSLVADVRAVLVTDRDLVQARQEILETLTDWSPQIEDCPFEIGSFWLNSSGLSGLYGSEAQWGTGVRRALAKKRYHAVVVVGLTRGGTYVLARSRHRSTVVRTREAEKRSMDAAPLTIFPLSLRHRRLLERLGVRTLAALVRIPPEELSRRFGPELVRGLRKLEAFGSLPLQTTEKAEEWSRSRCLDTPVSDRQALLPLVAEPLQEGLERLRKRGRLLAEWRMVFVLESRALVTEVLRPAEPTTHASTLLRLLELRLAHVGFATGVVEIRMALGDVAAPPGSGELFAPPPVRDDRRGAEAFAQIRARWGNGSVVRPVLVDCHIPELSFRWEEVERLVAPVPGPPAVPFLTAVRRVGLGPAGKLANPSGQRLGGPCRLRVASGEKLEKEYWFLRNGRREVSWVSWDRDKQTSRWEGVVD